LPKQRVHASQKARSSGKQAGALGVTCRAEKILVANRGEIAVRVIRTAHELEIPCVAVYSTIGKDALHVKLADESVCIGEAPSSQSCGCTMLHPGYGFLAENAVFVEMCREHGINFIGPNPDSIRVIGDKATARETMKDAGVPTVPGSKGLLSATAGGGGRGMRLAKQRDEFVKCCRIISILPAPQNLVLTGVAPITSRPHVIPGFHVPSLSYAVLTRPTRNSFAIRPFLKTQSFKRDPQGLVVTPDLSFSFTAACINLLLLFFPQPLLCLYQFALLFFFPQLTDLNELIRTTKRTP
ncbi:biotin carboxylase 2, chloroplastic, partial [Tanacetum coccineum]